MASLLRAGPGETEHRLLGLGAWGWYVPRKLTSLCLRPLTPSHVSEHLPCVNRPKVGPVPQLVSAPDRSQECRWLPGAWHWAAPSLPELQKRPKKAVLSQGQAGPRPCHLGSAPTFPGSLHSAPLGPGMASKNHPPPPFPRDSLSRGWLCGLGDCFSHHLPLTSSSTPYPVGSHTPLLRKTWVADGPSLHVIGRVPSKGICWLRATRSEYVSRVVGYLM